MTDGTTAAGPRRTMFVVAVVVLALVTVFAPARIIYKHNQKVSAGTAEVVIQGYAFTPSTLTVKAGTTVTFTNKDGATHTVTADDGSIDLGRIPGGGSVKLVVTKSFTYHCDIHSSMKASIVVGG